jgi:hypothetical protein
MVTGFNSGIVGTKWHWDRLLSDRFSCTLSVSFLHCAMLDFICAVSVPGGAGRGMKRAKPGGSSNKNTLLDVGKH